MISLMSCLSNTVGSSFLSWRIHGQRNRCAVLLINGFIVNDIKNFVFDPAKVSVYGFGRNRKQKFVMSFTIW